MKSDIVSALLVGFDAAWTAKNSGGLVGVLQHDGRFTELGVPDNVTYPQAEEILKRWLDEHRPRVSIVMLDQPTIVRNATGQRPVEGIAGSPVGRRRGGMQPANTSKTNMFGPEAPIWRFLDRFGGPADPTQPLRDVNVFETYPALAMIALDWMLSDARACGRLPKYNPANVHFSPSDWRHVCQRTAAALRDHALEQTPEWLDQVALAAKPTKGQQDGVDAAICLLVALQFAAGGACLMVGDVRSGYVLVPYGEVLASELEARCRTKDLVAAEWVHTLRMHGR